jgi:hypothetical protein
MSTSMSLEALRARALLYQNFREFFKSRSVVEVETPVLANDNAIIRGQPSERGNAYDLPLPAMQFRVLRVAVESVRMV